MSLPLFILMMALCCGYAAWRGGAPERLAAGLQIGAYALSVGVHRLLDVGGYRSTEGPMAAIDVALLVALVVLAHRSTRFWPLWLAAWQLVTVISHIAKLADPDMLDAGYAIQAQLWAYPMLLVTAIGAWRHQRRRSIDGVDPDWKVQPS